jgi:uncharacterized protein (TIGR00369 family)
VLRCAETLFGGKKIVSRIPDKTIHRYLPDAVEFVDALPRTATGKFLKTALPDRFRDYGFEKDPEARRSTRILGVDPGSGGAWVNGSGLAWERVSGSGVSAHVDAGPEHLTPWGVVHGGLYAMVAESAASVGASAAVLDRGQFAVGVDNVTDFLRPSSGGRLDLAAARSSRGRPSSSGR